VKAFLLVVAGVLAMFVAVEIVLVKVSRYRLTHGDGKEHAFRSGRGRTP
jgi:hypothetical protein